MKAYVQTCARSYGKSPGKGVEQPRHGNETKRETLAQVPAKVKPIPITKRLASDLVVGKRSCAHACDICTLRA